MKKIIISEDFIERRIDWITKLLLIQEDFSVWDESNKKLCWTNIREYGICNAAKSIYLHRQILNNEFVFDLDGERWKDIRILGWRLESFFERYNIPFLRCFSGRGLHYHVFWEINYEDALENSEVLRDVIYHYFRVILQRKPQNDEEIKNMIDNLMRYLPFLIIKEVGEVQTAHIDILKFKQRRGVIRMIGSINTKNNVLKTVIENLPRNPPEVEVYDPMDVVFPENIIVWNVDFRRIESLIERIYSNYFIRDIKPISQYSGRRKKGKIRWINKLLETPIPDGRKRVVNLVLAPYIVNVLKLSEDEAFKIIWGWLMECDRIRKLDSRINENYVKYQIKYSKERKLKPLSKEKAKEYFMDVPEILKVLDIGDF